MEYKFIEDSNVHEFEKKINEALKDGWKFQSNLACTSSPLEVELYGADSRKTSPVFTSYCLGMVKED